MAQRSPLRRTLPSPVHGGLRIAAWALASLIAAACGDDTSGASGDPGSGGGGVGGGGSGASGPGGGGVGGEGGGEPKHYAGYGYVTAASYAYTQPAYAGYSVTAGFSIGTPSSQGTTCTVETVGGCTVTTCDLVGGGEGSELVLVDAGAVSLTGGKQPVTLAPGPTKQYGAVTSGTTPLFDGGETLTATAAGSSDLEGFSVSVVAPAPVSFSAPSFEGSPSFSRSTPLSFAWAGGAAGKVRVFLSTTTTSSGQPIATSSVSCEADASVGQVVMPTDALSKLSSTGPNVTAQLSASVTNTANVEVGELLVSLVAVNSARGNGAGGQASALVTLL